MHDAALAVHGPAVGEHLAVRRVAAHRNAGQQRRLEPAAVLIAALKVHVRRPYAGGVEQHGGDVGAAGIEPAVERVGLLGEAGAAAAVRADEAVREEILRLGVKPDVRAVLAEEAGDLLNGLRRADGLAAVGAVEHRDGQTPAALAGDAPVGALADHGEHAVVAPAGMPDHLVRGGAGVVLERIDRAEPLRRGAEDDGLVAAPAVRVAVDDVLARKEHAALAHILENDRVGFLGLHAGVFAGVVGVAALVVHGDDHVHAVAAAGLVVVRAEAGRRVDAARAGVHRDILGVEQAGRFRQERVIGEHVLKERAGVRFENFVLPDAADAHDLLGERFGNDVDLAVIGLDERVALSRMQADAEVARQRPDRRCPDEEIELAVVDVGELSEIVMHRELDVHRGAGIVLILDLRLGERGLVVRAPVHGLETLVDVALLVHLPEHLDLFGFKLGVHGEIRMVPVAEHAEALEALALDADVLFGVAVAGGAELAHAHGLAVEPLLLDDGRLDGHAVVVPARGIGDLIAGHGFIAADEVLQALVQRVAHVQIAVRERRAVVQNEEGLALVAAEGLAVKIHVVPGFEHARLARGQTGTHGKSGFRQIYGGVVVHSCAILSIR